MKLRGKVVIVTGASSGIGLATARLLAQRGAKVVLAARSTEKLNKLMKELPQSLAISCDMTKGKQIRTLVKKTKEYFGRVDILINNAGQGYDASIEKINIETFRKLFELDVIGPVIAMQEVIPIMKKQRHGVIVNISSGTALMALPNMSAYSSLKRALSGISLTANEELKKFGIIVSVVFPYITLTDFEKNTIKEAVEFEEEASEETGDFQAPDPPEFVAEKIVEGIEKEEKEIFVHEWMKKLI